MQPDDAMPEVRISDAEREQVIDQLRSATADGRITMAEFEERAGQVYASKYASELSPVTADLPAPTSELTPVRKRADRPAKPVGKTKWAVQIMGGTERRGNWAVGDHVRSITIMGGQDLDLTEVTAEVVDLTCITVMGATDIIVPDGASVEMDGFMLFGGTGNAARTPGASTMTVRVRAFGAMGACEVRNLSKRERKKRGLPPA